MHAIAIKEDAPPKVHQPIDVSVFRLAQSESGEFEADVELRYVINYKRVLLFKCKATKNHKSGRFRELQYPTELKVLDRFGNCSFRTGKLSADLRQQILSAMDEEFQSR